MQVLRRRTPRSHVTGSQQARAQRQVQNDPRKGRICRYPQRMRTIQRAVIVDVQPIQTERNDKRPHGPQEPKIKPHSSGRADDDLVKELAEHDDVEGREAVDLVRDVNGSGVAGAEELLSRGGIAENPDALLGYDGDGGDSSFAPEREGVEEEREVNAECHAAEAEPEPLLRAVMIAGEGVEQVRGVAAQARDEVGADSGAHGVEADVHKHRVVAVDDEHGHDPQDEHALRQVVVVERVHELPEIRPHVPRWC